MDEKLSSKAFTYASADEMATTGFGGGIEQQF